MEVLKPGIDVLGDLDPDEYPLQPKKHSLEFLREKTLRLELILFLQFLDFVMH